MGLSATWPGQTSLKSTTTTATTGGDTRKSLENVGVLAQKSERERELLFFYFSFGRSTAQEHHPLFLLASDNFFFAFLAGRERMTPWKNIKNIYTSICIYTMSHESHAPTFSQLWVAKGKERKGKPKRQTAKSTQKSMRIASDKRGRVLQRNKFTTFAVDVGVFPRSIFRLVWYGVLTCWFQCISLQRPHETEVRTLVECATKAAKERGRECVCVGKAVEINQTTPARYPVL